MGYEDKKFKLPWIYKVESGSNVSKLYGVIGELFDEMTALFEDIRDLNDVNNATGVNLDLWGADYRLQRDGRTDTDYRALILARVANTSDGNNIDKILTFLGFFLPAGQIKIIPLFSSDVSLERQRPLAFIIYDYGFSDSLKETINGTLPILKAAGIHVEFDNNTVEEWIMSGDIDYDAYEAILDGTDSEEMILRSMAADFYSGV